MSRKANIMTFDSLMDFAKGKNSYMKYAVQRCEIEGCGAYANVMVDLYKHRKFESGMIICHYHYELLKSDAESKMEEMHG